VATVRVFTLRAGSLCAGLWLIQPLASATAAQTINVQVGEYEGYRNFALGWETKPLWYHVRRTRQELVPEFSIGYADYDGHVSASRNRLWHVGATAFYHWYFAPRSYLEVGVGPTLFTHSVIGNHVLSTHLQFGNSIGFAHRFADDWTLGVRLTHYSNAGIKRPNDGVNFLHVVARYSFR
jgi:lipid A 3-O-deacylase